jgi:hypothetical protein
MKTKKPTLKFQIDIVDYKNEDEILETIKRILKLSKDKDFLESIYWDNGGLSVEVSPNISFLINGCDCD